MTLSAGNGWSHTWSGLDDGCTWTVVEKECEGYTVRVEREGITFVMTNTYAAEIPDDPTPEAPLPPDPAKPTPGGPTLPQTGQVWWPVPLLLMTGLLLLAVGLFRRRTTGDEREKREKPRPIPQADSGPGGAFFAPDAITAQRVA